MRFFLLAVIELTAFLLCRPVAATDDLVTIGPAPAWVNVQPTPTADFADAGQRSTRHRLISEQSYLSLDQDAHYSRYRVEFTTIAAVEEFGRITITFDATYQTVVFHSLSVERGGKTQDRLPTAKFDTVEIEQAQETRAYSRLMTVSYAMPDVRAGDVIDYSFSVVGKNPALKGALYQSFLFQYPIPVQRLYRQLVTPETIDLNFKTYAGAQEPERDRRDGQAYYSWALGPVADRTAEENTAYWYAQFPVITVSNVPDWQTAGAFFASTYDVPNTIPAELIEVARQIAEEQSSPSAQARAALGWVQQQFRYLRVYIGGEGGYVPRSLSEIVATRFGDCKDMTLLLLTLLSQLDIDAVPVLVSSTLRGDIDRFQPSIGLFDHIIVRIRSGGRDIFVDPTAGEQLGTLETLAPAQFGKGLVVERQSPGLVSLPPSPHRWQQISSTAFVTAPNDPKVSMTVALEFFGAAADSLNAYLQMRGAKELEESYLKEFQGYYAGLSSTEPMQLQIDREAAHISLSFNYTIDDAWEISDPDTPGSAQTFETAPRYFSRYALLSIAKDRKTPRFITHPVRSKDILTYTVEPDWDVKDERFEGDFTSLRYLIDRSFKDGIITEVYEYETKANAVALDALPEVRDGLEIASDQLGFILYRNIDVSEAADLFGPDADIQETALAIFAICYFCLAIAGILTGFFHAQRKIRKWGGEAQFYPIHPTWFILLSIATLTLFHYYWAFRTWLYLDRQKDADISPFWRTVFLVFFAGPLTRQVAETLPDETLQKRATSIGLGYLGIFLLFRIYDVALEIAEIEISLWIDFAISFVELGVLTLLLIVPVKAVWRANDPAALAVQRQNTVSVGKILAIVLGLMTFAIIIFEGLGWLD